MYSLDTTFKFEMADTIPAIRPLSHDFDHLVQKLAHVCQAAWAAYEYSQRLQGLIQPFLSHATWLEAFEVARYGEQALPTITRQVSILRLDIVGFTQLLDSHPLKQVLFNLNTYLDQLTQLVYRYYGDVDKYLGDGFLAVFEQANDAVQAGCAIQQATADFNCCQAAWDGFVFPIRIGIDTGLVAITNLGSAARQERAVMGLPVNLAERLQAQATPGLVWFSQATFDQLHEPSGCRCLGPIQVKGRPEPVIVYEK